jgi:hypothetical protein
MPLRKEGKRKPNSIKNRKNKVTRKEPPQYQTWVALIASWERQKAKCPMFLEGCPGSRDKFQLIE